MIPKEHLKEFGFEDISKFPTALINHVVTISLPSAVVHHLEPAQVIIDRGLAIPVQVPGVPNGMIIRHDGKMVYINHENPADFATPLKVSFTQDIAFDVRIEAFNIMRRAVEIDPSLNDVWLEILSHWVKWYPLLLQEIKRQPTGEFATIADALKGFERFLEGFIGQMSSEEPIIRVIPFKIMVQTLEESAKSWQGEEFFVDESTVGQLTSKGVGDYVSQTVYKNLKKILQSPVFFTQSTFKLCYEPRVTPILKMIVVPPFNIEACNLSRGIDM